jgi:hypothetical protein
MAEYSANEDIEKTKAMFFDRYNQPWDPDRFLLNDKTVDPISFEGNVIVFYFSSGDPRMQGFRVLPLKDNPIQIGPQIDSGLVYIGSESARDAAKHYIETCEIRPRDYNPRLD